MCASKFVLLDRRIFENIFAVNQTMLEDIRKNLGVAETEQNIPNHK